MPKSDFASNVTWERVLSISWAFLWRGVIYSTLLGFVLGFIGGALGRSDLAGPVGAVLGSIASFLVSFLVMSIALKKRYGSYSVRLLPHHSAS